MLCLRFLGGAAIQVAHGQEASERAVAADSIFALAFCGLGNAYDW